MIKHIPTKRYCLSTKLYAVAFTILGLFGITTRKTLNLSFFYTVSYNVISHFIYIIGSIFKFYVKFHFSETRWQGIKRVVPSVDKVDKKRF